MARGYEIGLLKANSPLGPWKLASPEPIFGTRKRAYRLALAKEGGYAGLKFQDTQDPYCEAASNSLFIGPDGKLWSSCHYLMDENALIRTVKLFIPGKNTSARNRTGTL